MTILDKRVLNSLLSLQSRMSEINKAREILQHPEKHQSEGLIRAWAVIAEGRKLNKESKECEEAFLECAKIIQLSQNASLLYECYADLGNALNFCESYENALKYYKDALVVANSLSKKNDELINLFSQMAYCSAELGLWQQETDYLMNALQGNPKPLIKATLLERIALSYRNSGQYGKSVMFYEEAITIFKAENFNRGWNDRLNNLVRIYLSLGDKEAAEKTRKRLMKSS